MLELSGNICIIGLLDLCVCHFMFKRSILYQSVSICSLSASHYGLFTLVADLVKPGDRAASPGLMDCRIVIRSRVALSALFVAGPRQCSVRAGITTSGKYDVQLGCEYGVWTWQSSRSSTIFVLDLLIFPRHLLISTRSRFTSDGSKHRCTT